MFSKTAHRVRKEGRMITISVCMIVKNEEKVLARCLDSLRPIADEIIIADTGSTDATKEIAARYTDKIFDFTWVDDFAAARNFVFSKASGDYIYSADADEVLDEVNCKKFLRLKEALLPEIEMVQFLYTNQLQHNTTYNYDTEYRPKLYKRLREFVWEDPLHESVRKEPVIYDSDIAIIHMPERPHGTRDFEIMQKTIRTRGGLSKKLRKMYARELFIAGKDSDFLNAEPYFTEILEASDTETEGIAEALCVLAKAGAAKQDTESFFKTVLKAVATGNPPAEICTLLGEHFETSGEYAEAAIWYYNAAFETEPVLSLSYGTKIPLAGLVRCKRTLGDEASASDFERKLQEYT